MSSNNALNFPQQFVTSGPGSAGFTGHFFVIFQNSKLEEKPHFAQYCKS